MILVLIIVLIIIIYAFGMFEGKSDNKSDNKTKIIQTLVRQAARWAVAAQQDESPLIALLHANYAAGYLWALRDIATDIEIHENTGLDMHLFKNKIIAVQEMATKKVSSICPQFVGEIDKYLLTLAGDV